MKVIEKLKEIKDKIPKKGKEHEEQEVEVPEPPKKKMDPRYLIQAHRNGYQDVRKLETELKHVETDYLYRLNELKKQLQGLEKELRDAGYTEDALIQNRELAIRDLTREDYEFLE